MLGLRAGWRRPTASVLTYGGKVVAAHRLGDGWARWRRTGEAEVGDDEAAQRVDPLGTELGEAVLCAGKSSGRRSGRTTAAHWARKSSGRRSGRTTAAHWAGTSSGRWSGTQRDGGLGVLAGRRGVAGWRRRALGAAVRSSRSGRRGARDSGGEEDRRRRSG